MNKNEGIKSNYFRFYKSFSPFPTVRNGVKNVILRR